MAVVFVRSWIGRAEMELKSANYQIDFPVVQHTVMSRSVRSTDSTTITIFRQIFNTKQKTTDTTQLRDGLLLVHLQSMLLCVVL